MSFPATFPPDCPLPDARDCDGTVYMLSLAAVLTAEQCRSQAERGRAVDAGGEYVCMRHGLSVFPKLESCRHQGQLFPRLGSKIMSAHLTAEHGKVRLTSGKQPDHMTWWPYAKVARHELFSCVAEV